LRRNFGDDPLGRGGADAGQAGQRLGVLVLDGPGHLAHRANHGPQRLFHAHAVDRAEQLEELALDFGQKADQPRREPPLHGVAFQVFDRVQANLLAQPGLQLPSRKLGNQHLVLEGVDAQREHVLVELHKLAGDLGDQGCELLPTVIQAENPQMTQMAADETESIETTKSLALGQHHNEKIHPSSAPSAVSFFSAEYAETRRGLTVSAQYLSLSSCLRSSATSVD
jgi:hypothetical protein